MQWALAAHVMTPFLDPMPTAATLPAAVGPLDVPDERVPGLHATHLLIKSPQLSPHHVLLPLQLDVRHAGGEGVEPSASGFGGLHPFRWGFPPMCVPDGTRTHNPRVNSSALCH